MTTRPVARQAGVRTWLGCQLVLLVLWLALASLAVRADPFNVLVVLFVLLAPCLSIAWLVNARRPWWKEEVAQFVADRAKRRRYELGMTAFAALLVGLWFLATRVVA